MTSTATAGAVAAEVRGDTGRATASGWRTDALLLAGALLVAALLRLPFVDQQSFWLDETLTVGTAAAPRLSDALANVPGTESAPALYFALAWAWAQPFGVSEASLHALSALFGVATVAVVWFVGREVGGRTAATAAALLCAVHPAAVWYSLDARPYALGTLVAALTVLAALRTRRPGRAGLRALAAWSVLAALMLTTQYMGVWLVGLELLLLLVWARVPRSLVLLAALPVGVVGLAILPVLEFQRRAVNQLWIDAIPLEERLGDTWRFFLLGPSIPTWRPAIPAAAVALVLVALAVWRGSAAARFALGLALGTVGAVVLLAPEYLLNRNTLPALAPLLAVLGAGAAVRVARRPVGLVVAAALGGLMLAVTVNVLADWQLQRPDWRGVARLAGPAAEQRVVYAVGSFSARGLDMAVGGVRTGGLPVTTAVIVVPREPVGRRGCYNGQICNMGRPDVVVPQRVGSLRREAVRRHRGIDVITFRSARPVPPPGPEAFGLDPNDTLVRIFQAPDPPTV